MVAVTAIALLIPVAAVARSFSDSPLGQVMEAYEICQSHIDRHTYVMEGGFSGACLLIFSAVQPHVTKRREHLSSDLDFVNSVTSFSLQQGDQK